MIPQLQRNTPVSSPESAPQWSLATRIAFRFFFSYFLLYVYPRSVGSLGAFVKYNNPLRDLWHAVVPWVGAHVLHLSGDFTEVANGSGDQLYDWVLLFCIFVTAIVATAIWSWLDRKRPNYEVLYQWLRIFVRLSVAVAMVIYGTDKIFRMQFPEPPLARWVDPVAQIPPMSLLWVTVGYSHLYSIFGGLGEMAGAILLLVPRFTALGALITAGVMSNVLMLNLGYDVPRKIYSIHLIAFCLFLLIPGHPQALRLFPAQPHHPAYPAGAGLQRLEDEPWRAGLANRNRRRPPSSPVRIRPIRTPLRTPPTSKPPCAGSGRSKNSISTASRVRRCSPIRSAGVTSSSTPPRS